ncbi:MAG: recombination mediator RecR [Candidatus Hydrothermales bacterium]
MNELIKDLILAFNELPGIGEKSAERIVFFLLDKFEERLDYFIEKFKNLRDKIKICSLCNNFDNEDPCRICKDEKRENILMVVSTPKEVWTFEKTGEYSGKYFVLGGLLSPLENIYPEDLKLEKLLKVLRDKKVGEIILAFPPIPEGEATFYFLIEKLKEYNLKITKFRSGIPMGTTFDYLDDYTLKEVLKNREVIKVK